MQNCLIDKGLDVPTAAEKTKLIQTAARLLTTHAATGGGGEHAASGPDKGQLRVFYVPGRIEVVGKHTDYCGGRSLLAATNKAFCVVTRERPDSLCRIFSTQNADSRENGCTLDMSAASDITMNNEPGHWSMYPATAVQRLSSNFADHNLKGLDMAIACDIPPASGMSSSSAMICAIFLALDARNNIRSLPTFQQNIKSDEDLYEYLGCNENGQTFRGLEGNQGVGTFGGSEDHTAIMSCTRGRLNQFSYCPTTKEATVAFPADDVVFVIGVSSHVAEKTGDKKDEYNDQSHLALVATQVYNEQCGIPGCDRSRLLKAAVDHARAQGGTVEAALEAFFRQHQATLDSLPQFASPAAAAPGHDSDRSRVDSSVVDLLRRTLSAGTSAKTFTLAQLKARVEQFAFENEHVVPGVARAFADKDWAALGDLVAESQRLTDTKLRNVVDETRFLHSSAMGLGALAASAFGAGFGGSVWALVKKDRAHSFREQWAQQYRQHFPGPVGEHSSFFECTPGPGAFEVKPQCA